MPTTTPLTDAINALTTYSNTVTGASDTTLSDAVATLAAGYGGGGGLELIDTITIAENTRGYSLDVTTYTSYDIIVVCFDSLNIAPDQDWLYTTWNTTTPSGGSYVEKITTLNGIHAIGYKAGLDNDIRWLWESFNGTATLNKSDSASLQTIFMYTYSASNYITAGSVIKVYGANL